MPENAVYNWDAFDSHAYAAHNYAVMSESDRQILTAVREFFARVTFPRGARGIDVGSGANLYPALSMLPYCVDITLLEHASTNVAWLREQTADYAPMWDQYWDLLAESGAYRAVADPRAELSRRARVRQGSLLEPVDGGRWDVGTMFFVAESYSTSPDEFRLALGRFCGLLHSGAPFAIAFMENSQGYDVADHRFPAVAVDSSHIEDELKALALEFTVSRIDVGAVPLRDGYTGMLLARGRVR
jgi:hypothetical protein